MRTRREKERAVSTRQLDEAPIAARSAASVDAWHRAWADTVHFIGDPFATLAEANAGDDDFVMGSVFCAAYRILGGASPDTSELVVDLERANERPTSGREAKHVEAVNQLALGNFTDAALIWDAIAPGDFAAGRFAHDTYLHVGEVDRRLDSSERALAHFETTSTRPFVASQHAFSLEEAGAYREAESLAWSSLVADPMELWALHALAHVYESTNDQDAAIDLLESRAEVWTAQDSLAVHIHWHHALRMIVAGEHERALALFDELEPVASTPFRLCDVASMLWRLELAGCDVGDRWGVVADRMAGRPERHTSGFLDLHMALAFQRAPDHEAAATFFAAVGESHADDMSENGETFRTVVTPLVEAIRLSDVEPLLAAALLDSVADQSNRIGGSIAQRELITITGIALHRRAIKQRASGPEENS